MIRRAEQPPHPSGIAEHTLAVLEFPAVTGILASYASSPLGRRRIGDIQPSTDYDQILRSIEETTELKDRLCRAERLPLAGLEDIGAVIAELPSARAPLEPRQLADVASTLDTATALRKFFAERRGEMPRMWGVASQISDFTHIVKEIHRCIDTDKTVRDSASPKLRELRRAVTRLRARIQAKMSALVNSSELQSAIENKNVSSRNGRPVIAIRSSCRAMVHGTLLDRSKTGLTSFIEPHAVSETVNELEGARYEEAKEVARILWELTRMISERSADVLESLARMAHIDFTNAKAAFSLDYHMTAPELSKSPALDLRAARHPLLIHFARMKGDSQLPRRPEDVFDEVVPITVRLGRDFNLLIVTGPNTGGKTVTLKTIGLLALMAQSGMHIPADWGTVMPVFKQVFADIGDEQSLEQSLSTFSSHMTNIARILDSAHRDTLVLLDELGSGTDPAEGAALGTAILDYLHSREARVIATTHLGSLKTYAYTTPRAENASMEFDIKTLMPTFRLLLGQPGSSNATAIAKRLGMPAPVLERAERMLTEEETDTTSLINKVQQTRVAAERSRGKAEKLRAYLKQEIAETKKAKQEAVDEAHNLIEYTINDIKAVVDEYAHAALNAPKPWSERSSELQTRVTAIAAGTPLAKLRSRFLESIREGDTVYVAPLNGYGTVLKIRRARKQMRVKVGDTLFDVPFQQIEERPFARRDPRIARKKQAATAHPVKPSEKQPTDKRLPPSKVKAFIASLKPGDRVYAPALRSAGAVRKIDMDGKHVTLDVGGLEIELPFTKIRPCRKHKQNSSPTK